MKQFIDRAWHRTDRPGVIAALILLLLCPQDSPALLTTQLVYNEFVIMLSLPVNFPRNIESHIASSLSFMGRFFFVLFF